MLYHSRSCSVAPLFRDSISHYTYTEQNNLLDSLCKQCVVDSRSCMEYAVSSIPSILYYYLSFYVCVCRDEDPLQTKEEVYGVERMMSRLYGVEDPTIHRRFKDDLLKVLTSANTEAWELTLLAG